VWAAFTHKKEAIPMMTLNANPYAKTLAVTPASCAITLGLIYLMHALVYVDRPNVVDHPAPKLTPVVMEVDPIETIREEPPTRVDEPTRPPENKVLPKTLTPDEGYSTIIPDMAAGHDWDRTPKILGGGQLLPFMRVQPNYPRRALSRGVEGFVDVVFDVTEYGATDNISVIYSEPSGVFDRASIKAVSQWKYKPHHIDELPVRTYGLKERIRFRIAD